MATYKNDVVTTQGMLELARATAARLRSHPMTWAPENTLGPDLHKSPGSYVFDIREYVEEVDSALKAFKILQLNGDAVNKDLFPLPTLGPILERACGNVYQGSGIATLRGLDPSRYCAEDNVILFLALASYIGDVRGVQDKRGSMLSHITDSKNWTDVVPELRHGIHTNSMLPWHTDMGCECLALHVRGLADRGGHTWVTSSWTIFQELTTSYPKHLEVLSSPSWPIQISGNPPRFISISLLQIHEGKVLLGMDPGRLGLHPATEQIKSRLSPRLSMEQRRALEVLSTLAAKYRLRLDHHAGDMVFIHNWSLLHARDAYVDESSQRHLVRLWLRNSSLGWSVPDSMKAPWEAAYGPKGDGNPWFILSAKDGLKGTVEKRYPVVPALDYKPPKYTTGSAAFMLEDVESVNAADTSEDGA